VFAQNAPHFRAHKCTAVVAVDLDALQLGNPRFGDSDDRTNSNIKETNVLIKVLRVSLCVGIRFVELIVEKFYQTMTTRFLSLVVPRVDKANFCSVPETNQPI